MDRLLIRAEAAGGAHGAAGGKDDAAQKAAKAAAKAAKRAHQAKGFNICWWIFAGICGVFAIIYAYSLLKAWYIRRKVGPLRAQGVAPTSTKPRSIGAMGRALHAIGSNYAYVKVFPAWIYSSSTAAEWFWTAAYTGIVLGMTAWVTLYQGSRDFSNPMGYAVSIKHACMYACVVDAHVH